MFALCPSAGSRMASVSCLLVAVDWFRMFAAITDWVGVSLQETRGVLVSDRGRCCTRVGVPRGGMVAGVWWACLEGVGLRVESARAVVACAVAWVGVFVRVLLEALGVWRGVGWTGLAKGVG